MFIWEFGQPQLCQKTRNCHVLPPFLITTPNVKFREYLFTWNGADKNVTDKTDTVSPYQMYTVLDPFPKDRLIS
jgi:hypothetical protein